MSKYFVYKKSNFVLGKYTPPASLPQNPLPTHQNRWTDGPLTKAVVNIPEQNRK
jgi:hypothetical protein